MPQAWFDRVAEDKTAFQFQKAWIQKAERIKKQRMEYFENHPGPEGLSMASLPDAVRQQISVAGTVRVPMIAIKYANTGADPFPISQVQDQYFDGPTTSDGTVTDFYAEMSYGAVNLTGDVYGWVTGSQIDTFYEGGGGCNGLCGTAGTGLLIQEALVGVDGSVDFGQYDNDGPDGLPNSGDDDGFVDFIAIVHPETGGECGGPNMWSHRWVVSGWPQFPGPWNSNDPASGGGFIKVFDYTIQPIMGGLSGCLNNQINSIGVYAHEFGHAFGLPDFYDTNGGGQGIGEHGLMGSGSWQNPYNPTHMAGFCKLELGWIAGQEVGPTLQNYGIDVISTNQDLYRLNIYEEKFKRSTFTPLAGTASLLCGLPTTPAGNRGWAAGSGYGNSWDERVQHQFGYDGNDPVNLEYDVSYDTEVDYDYGRAIISVNGTETILAEYDGVGSANNVPINLTPYLSGSGASEYLLIFEFTSDFASGAGGPFKIDNVSVIGGGENYFSDFEQYEDGWCYGNEPREYFLVENRKKNVGTFDKYLNAEGLLIWHCDEAVGDNTNGSSAPNGPRPARLALEQADGANDLEGGANRGDAGDSFPGGTSNTNFDETTTPNSRSNNGFIRTSVVTSISPSQMTMTADMKAGRFPPTLASITPNTGDNDQVVTITALLGTFMYKGGTFCLSDGQNQYPATTVVWTGKAKVGGDLDLNGVPSGVYDVVWKGPDGQEATLAQAFTVNAVASGVDDVPTNHPNPFNPATTISYSIKDPGRVTLRVYNAAGQLVRTLVDDVQAPRAGGFSVVWDGRNDMGAPVSSGVYMYKLTAAQEFQSVKKLVLLK
jgi:M6 family metalloprotease-like protein